MSQHVARLLGQLFDRLTAELKFRISREMIHLRRGEARTLANTVFMEISEKIWPSECPYDMAEIAETEGRQHLIWLLQARCRKLQSN